MFEVVHRALGQRRVLKLVAEEGRGDLEDRLRFEAQTLARLEHPNLLKVHDLGTFSLRPRQPQLAWPIRRRVQRLTYSVSASLPTRAARRYSLRVTISRRETLLKLINRAVNPTAAVDEEARTAAVQACEMLAKRPELIAPPTEAGFGAPPRPPGPSTIHPEALALREWNRMFRRKNLTVDEACEDRLCAACGRRIAEGEPIISLNREELSTHEACKAWWWRYEPAPEPTPGGVDDDIPF